MTTSTTGPVLLGIDVHGIQRYLFATSKLKEIIGASRIVDDFTGMQPNDVPALCLAELKLAPVTAGTPTGSNWYIPVRLGGGVVRLLLPSADLARQFVRSMSEWALTHAHGLEFDASWVSFDLVNGDYSSSNAQLIQHINAARSQSSTGNGFNGFPFSAPCRLTGDTAEGYDGPNERICRASMDKREYQRRFDDRWATVSALPILEAFKVANPKQPFIDDLESMHGDNPADSYMAVVALDANNLGQAGKQALGAASGIAALHATRSFVEKVATDTSRSFSVALDALATNSQSAHEYQAIGRVVEDCGKLPLRPLVFGGDDLTFVMHAAIAPRFAVELASAMEATGLKSGVGIAFVKTNAPLSRAIDLAESLVARAKKAGREHTHLDFMFCSAEIPPDASDRDARGSRVARGPYRLEGFRALLENARILNHELPSSHVRGAADGFQQSLAAGREFIRDLCENIDRGLGGGARATDSARKLLEKIAKDDTVAATYLDCVDLRRFIAPRPDRGTPPTLAPQKTEVNT